MFACIKELRETASAQRVPGVTFRPTCLGNYPTDVPTFSLTMKQTGEQLVTCYRCDLVTTHTKKIINKHTKINLFKIGEIM